MRQWIVVFIVAFCVGCRVSGTIGGTTDCDSRHNVDVSITFSDRG